MGRTYFFECSKCGYRAKVSGGADRGFHFAVQTVLCFECKELHDAVTEFRKTAVSPLAEPVGRKRMKLFAEARARKAALRPPTFLAALSRLPPPGAKSFFWQRYAPACPAFPRHRIRAWNQPDRCPKCGVILEQSALPYRIWE
jgi:hypothetical protein